MNTFNKKSLCVALAATGVMGVAGVAQAVNVSADGLGQVLIYPYYTVNKDWHGNSFNTLMSVVNTTASTKAIKVRFREGRNSVEVLDFNVFLSPFDVWTATITPTSAGGGHIATGDTSCTIPTFPSAGVDFRTGAITDGDDAITRTSEGYIEVFEMATYTDAGVIGTNAKHTSAGVPKDCSKVTDTAASLAVEQGAPQGGLFGSLYILSPYGGAMYSQPAVALDNFSTTAAYYTTGQSSPTYGDAVPAVSNTIIGNALYQSAWASGFDAVSAVLMTNAVTNEYVLDKGTKSQTTWIITFPSKFAYVNGSAAVPPFTKTYKKATGACENFYGVVFNREEGTPQFVTGTDFSPQPAPGAGPTMCWEAQSVSFGPAGNGKDSSNIFGSANNATITTPYSNGWATLGFNSPTNLTEHVLVNQGATAITNLGGGVTQGATATYYGLPIVGFGAQTFENEALAVAGKVYLSTFGASFPHHPSKKVSQ